MSDITLKRTVTLPFLVFYGMGTILGAGVYVLVGKVVGYSGYYVPIAFILSALLASFTGLSYSELASRIPRNAGEVAYINEAFSSRILASIIGYLVILTGIVSSATIAKGFAGYLNVFIAIPEPLVIILLILILGGIACWGISESMFTVSLITLIEIVGLLIVIFAMGDSLGKLPDQIENYIPTLDANIWQGIFLGAFLAFYAFIGFEDMVNIAEEAVSPEKTIPRAIIISVVLSTLLYFMVALIATLAVPLEQIANSKAPLADILAQKGKFFPKLISVISLVAIVNGSLVQIIMASRVLYGMSSQGLLHASMAKLHKKTRTPLNATVLVSVIVLSFCFAMPLKTLAETTSFIIVSIFILINLALIRIKIKTPDKKGIFKVPYFIPILGVVFSTLFIAGKVFFILERLLDS